MRKIIEFFRKDNNKIEENIKLYDEKEKIKQQESKILGQKLAKREANKEKSVGM